MKHVSVIVPTLNEADNVVAVIGAIDAALTNADVRDFEILIVDDESPDGTAQLAARCGNPHTRVVRRSAQPRALAASVIDGIELARGEIVVVMDADFSHPPERVPALVRAVEEGAVVAVGSRYVPGGRMEDWPYSRQLVSRIACIFARPLTPVRDATSGFFCSRRAALQSVTLSPHGFKIGLDVFVKLRRSGPIRELPYVFRDRRLGKSKFGAGTVLWFLRQVATLALDRARSRGRRA